jgi:hypothetical protein
MSLLQLHLMLVSFWFGLWAAETVLELSARDPQSTRTIASLHRWIDVLFEMPVAIAVLITGGALLARMWPVGPLALVHAAAGVIPAAVNLLCFGYVYARAKTDDEARARDLTRKVKLTGYAIPVAVIAMVIGFSLVSAG